MYQRIVFPVSVVAFSIASAHAADTYELNTPRLTGMDNFRDIAGTTEAYATANDGVMRAGVFYRSNVLTPTADDLIVLNSLGISSVFDLRSDWEVSATPDALPSGAQYFQIDILGGALGLPNGYDITTAQEAGELMEATNRAFVSDASTREQFKLLFEELALTDGAALFHCSSGKDRTGWATAVLLSIAGVSSETILENYMATNAYTSDRVTALLASLPADQAAMWQALMVQRPEYLQAGLNEAAALYGSMEGYLESGLGLSKETIYVLRGKMVYFSSLPGQAELLGNAAAGAKLLQELQNSSLSGAFTAYNYYLQSSIEQGNLNRVESKIGGQVLADTASYLLRQGSLIQDSAQPLTTGIGLRTGQRRIWSTGIADQTRTGSSNHTAGSDTNSQGMMVGLTQNFNDMLSGYASFGYVHGGVNAADGHSSNNTTFLSVGTRFAPDGLEKGLFMSVHGLAGYVDYDSSRDLTMGLGTAKGETHGSLTGAGLDLGYRAQTKNVTVEPSLGVRYSQLELAKFNESGSELALDVDETQGSNTAALANLNISLAPIELSGGWRVSPGGRVRYTRDLDGHDVNSSGSVEGLTVRQRAAFNSKDQFSAALNVSANLKQLTFAAEVTAVKAGRTDGLAGSLKVGYDF
ncbi:autotransporter domain-containing protein [Pantoea sp. Ap-967]|uniref:tyrosine-protein phosphatase n=1 Tax=Pantoea sp. Ap-967 TaxID=2608362 RepID=UPI001424143A|nr:tyrosine-protein phosphatase [Pantoea sp. Ap-967]NIE78036.1 autotransporter domain-containing protein [Pantoea sp. Ap-967]